MNQLLDESGYLVPIQVVGKLSSLPAYNLREKDLFLVVSEEAMFSDVKLADDGDHFTAMSYKALPDFVDDYNMLNWRSETITQSYQAVSAIDYRKSVKALLSLVAKHTESSQLALTILLSAFHQKTEEIDLSYLIHMAPNMVGEALNVLLGTKHQNLRPEDMIVNGGDVFAKLAESEKAE